MSTLYVDRADTLLEVNQGVLCVSVPGDVSPRRLPLKYLDRVVLRADTQLSSKLLCALAQQDVALLALGGRRGDQVAQLLGTVHNDARRRWQQALVLSQPLACAAFARGIVRAKVRRQRTSLQRMASMRPDLRKPLFDGVQRLDRVLSALRRDDEANELSLNQIRGMEGAAAASYFEAFFTAFAPALEADGRNRRPPRDPVNVLLSLSYTLLYAQAASACWAAGLDPALGALHTLQHGRAALACDIMEPYRPAIDLWVWELFRSGPLRSEHFGRDGSGACLLSKAGRGHFYPAWEDYSRQLQRSLQRYAQAVARGFDASIAQGTWTHLEEGPDNP